MALELFVGQTMNTWTLFLYSFCILLFWMLEVAVSQTAVIQSKLRIRWRVSQHHSDVTAKVTCKPITSWESPCILQHMGQYPLPHLSYLLKPALLFIYSFSTQKGQPFKDAFSACSPVFIPSSIRCSAGLVTRDTRQQPPLAGGLVWLCNVACT